MVFSKNTSAILFKLFAVLSIIVALYHFAAIFYSPDESPHWRHLLFIGINFFCFYGIIKRPRWFIFFLAILMVQQYYSHGSYLIKLWNEQGKVHWISVFDLLFLPVLFVCFAEDNKMKKGKLFKPSPDRIYIDNA